MSQALDSNHRSHKRSNNLGYATSSVLQDNKRFLWSWKLLWWDFFSSLSKKELTTAWADRERERERKREREREWEIRMQLNAARRTPGKTASRRPTPAFRAQPVPKSWRHTRTRTRIARTLGRMPTAHLSKPNRQPTNSPTDKKSTRRTMLRYFKIGTRTLKMPNYFILNPINSLPPNAWPLHDSLESLKRLQVDKEKFGVLDR